MRHRLAFTLTEILIALGLVAFLMILISRVFTVTANTISAGTAASEVLRTQKAIQQTLSNDFLGYSASGNIDQSDNGSGMAPLIVTPGDPRGAPFLSISCFRVPTYKSEADKRSHAFAPDDAENNFITRSSAVRSEDLDGDGSINTGRIGIDAGGEVFPIYAYGERNFRCDTIGFFANGRFQSQTGTGKSASSALVAQSAWIWYGHLRVFNSNWASLDTTQGHGNPGMWQTEGTTPEPNINNRYAGQFRLGRYQLLLLEPEDHDGNPATPTVPGGNGVEVPFAARSWIAPTEPGRSMTPLSMTDIDSVVGIANGATVHRLQFDEEQEENYPAWPPSHPVGTAKDTRFYMCRTDVAATGMNQFRERVAYRDEQDRTTPPGPGQNYWWESIPTGWTGRFYVNPFPAMRKDDPSDPNSPLVFKSRGLSQSKQLLAEGVTQFIVEFAGDFDATPGLDFDMIGGVQRIRWYGLPRDLDGDGVIETADGDVMTCTDYGIPPTNRTFERFIPGTTAGYQNFAVEPGNDPNASRYTCVWGPAEFASGRVPYLIRITVEIRDSSGRLSEPQTQEYVFPVRVKQ